MHALDAYRAQARYNRWFNAKLYGVAATLSDEERRRELGAFFGSVHRTLNHLILCDHVWVLRCAPERGDAVPLDDAGNLLRPASLDAVLYDDFELLRRRRAALDTTIEDWIGGLTAGDLDRELRYRTSKGEPCAHPLWWALSHLFNHQTHHRGQVTALLSQLGRDPGVTDMIAMLRE